MHPDMMMFLGTVPFSSVDLSVQTCNTMLRVFLSDASSNRAQRECIVV